jgi:hypothetical protein
VQKIQQLMLILNLKTNVDMDLSIPKNVNENVEEIEGVT